MGTFDRALEAALEASRIMPLDATALEQLASLYADSGDAIRLGDTAAALRQAVPNRAKGIYYAAAAEFLAGRLDAALTLIDRAVALDPTDAFAFNLRGAIHAQRGNVDAARAAFVESLRLNPRDVATYTNFGLLELEAGRRSVAADLFAEALALDPTSEASRQGLAEARTGGP